VAAAAAGLRLAPLVGRGGPIRFAADYDEGVYFAVGAALWRGSVPYRDFVFAHPPGWPVLLGWLSFLGDPSTAFAVARVVSVAVGVATAVVVAGMAARAFGRPAGLVAGVVYATFPEAVQAERTVLLEPALNLLAVLGVGAWLAAGRRPHGHGARRWACLAGVLLGLALTVKLWAAVAVVACLVGAPPSSWRRAAAFLAGLAAAVVAVAGAAAAVAGSAMVEQVVLFQARRPPAGGSLLGRLAAIVAGHPGITVLTALAVAAVVAARGRGPAAVAAVWHLGLVLVFMASSSYFDHYAAHLAPSAALLAGYAATTAAGVVRREGAARRLVGGAVAVSVGIGLMVTVADVGKRSGRTTAAGALVAAVAPDACVFSFDPVWLVAGDRLPVDASGSALAADPYAGLLLEATEHERFDTEREGFAHPASIAAFELVARRCEYVLVGSRGRATLGEQLARLAATHDVVAEAPGGIDLWRARPG
jgi:hypothetical protein